MARTGRRPGKHDTRADIVAAARSVFAEAGYARASLRGIAHRAGVDPALVHHYFDGKAPLFVAVMGLPPDLPGKAADLAAHKEPRGSEIVLAFLRLWDAHAAHARGPHPFLSLIQAMTSSPEAAASFAEFAAERFSPVAVNSGGQDGPMRRGLVGSQLLGLGIQRYILRSEPLATAAPEQLAAWTAPTIDRYLNDPLPARQAMPEVPRGHHDTHQPLL
jgi:AcrR family transcriptional regulator